MVTKIETKEWEKVRIDECFDIQQGKQVSKVNRLGHSQHPFLRTANVFWDRLDLTVLDHMHFTLEEEKKYALQKGDLLLCEGGDVGRTAMWHGELDRCYYQNHLHRLRKRNNNIDENFFHLYLKYAFLYARLYLGRSNITTIPNLSKSRLSELEIPLPPFCEQNAIAQTLIVVQNAITEQEKLIAKLKELKQSTMQHLFAHGIKGEKTKMTEIGEVPDSWGMVRLGDACDISASSVTFKQAETRIGGIVVFGVKVSDMNILGNEKYLKKSVTTFHFNDTKRLIPPGAIVFPKRGAAIATNKKRISVEYSLLDPNLIAIVPKQGLSSDFIFYFFEMFDLTTLTDPGTIPQLNKKDLAPVPLPLPSMDEQQKIVSAIGAIENLIEVSREKLMGYRSLFKTLLHELMSGERRVNTHE